MPTLSTSPIDVAPLITALVSLLTTFGGLMVWYVRTTVKKQEALLDRALARNDKLSDDLGKSEKEKVRLIERERSLKEDIDDLREQVDSLRRDMDALHKRRDTERETARQEGIRFQDQILDRDRQIKTLKDEIKRLSDLYDTIQSQLNTLNVDYAAVVSERDKLREQTKALAEQVKQMQDENAAVTTHNATLDQQVKDLQYDVMLLRNPKLAEDDNVTFELMRKIKEELPMNQPIKPEDVTPPEPPKDAA